MSKKEYGKLLRKRIFLRIGGQLNVSGSSRLNETAFSEQG
jgi:hypothetical protein